MFISRDPIGLMGGMNTFQYAPNPTGWIDPFGLKKHSVYGLYKSGASNPFYIGITNNLAIRRVKHIKDGCLVGNEQIRELYSDLDYETARSYEEGCIEKWETLTGVRLKKGETSNFKDDNCKTRGNKCHSFVQNPDGDKKRQQAMNDGKSVIDKNGCKNNPIP